MDLCGPFKCSAIQNSFSTFFFFPFLWCKLPESVKFERSMKTLQVATGLLIAEVNVNTMCELGSGGVSLVNPHSRLLKIS